MSGFRIPKSTKTHRTWVLPVRPAKLLWLPIAGAIGYTLLHGAPHLLFQYEYAASGAHLSCTYVGKSIKRMAPVGDHCPLIRLLKSSSDGDGQ